MEQMLLNLDVDAADDEELNAIFRCAHSSRAARPPSAFPTWPN
jgi:two-component system chemotaxis sensor kinase CheA